MRARDVFKTLFLMAVCLVAFASCGGSADEPPPPDKTVPVFKEARAITASDAEDFGYFGTCVAIDGDYAIVGGGFAGDVRGKGYVLYRLQGGADGWGETKILRGSDTVNMDSFGYAVAIAGEHAMVGAANAGGNNNSGAAYIFSRDLGGAGNWGEARKLVAADPQIQSRFGASVAIDGDIAAVGAPDAGYYRNAGGPDQWGQVKRIVPTSPDHYDLFGTSIALKDGVLAVGAPFSGMGQLYGAAYVFYRDSGGADNWGEVKRLVANDAEIGDQLGSSIGLDGNYVVAGSEYEDGAGDMRGAAYVFHRALGGPDSWGQIRKLTASDAQDQDGFGVSVAVSGMDFLIGAPYKGESRNNRGLVLFYSPDLPGGWGERCRCTASDAQDDDGYGFAVAIDGDYAIVGARFKNGPGSYRGTVYILKRDR
jgi:hypothetical protein